jgi:hypothetical protein
MKAREGSFAVAYDPGGKCRLRSRIPQLRTFSPCFDRPLRLALQME